MGQMGPHTSHPILKLFFRMYMAHAEVQPHAEMRRNQIFELKV